MNPSALPAHHTGGTDRGTADAFDQSPKWIRPIQPSRPAAPRPKCQESLHTLPEDVVDGRRVAPGRGCPLALASDPPVVQGVLEDVVEGPVVHLRLPGKPLDGDGPGGIPLEQAYRRGYR